MTNSIDLIRGNDGTNLASTPTVTSLRTAGSTTLAVNTVTGLPASFIAEMGTPNLVTGLIGNGVVFRGHTSSGQIVIDAIAAGYTDAGSAVNDIIVLKPTAEWSNNIANVLAVAHNDDGSLNATAASEIKAVFGADTNFRLIPRSTSTTSTATLAPNIDSDNIYDITAQAVALAISAPTGTPNPDDIIVIRLKDNGTSQTITWDSAYTNVSGLDSLTATTLGKWHTIGIMWQATAAKWQIVSISTEA